MDSSEIWLMGGHQRAVEGSSLPPCLQGGCQETLPLQGFRGREDKEGRIIVSAIPAGSLAWKMAVRGGALNVTVWEAPHLQGWCAGKFHGGLGLDLASSLLTARSSGERRPLAHHGVSYNPYEVAEARICAVPDPRAPPGSWSSLQAATKIHPSFSPVLMSLDQFGIRLTGACGYF